jgi:protein TonB
MFDQTFVDTNGQTRKAWTVPVSLAAQGVLVGALVIMPILHPGLLQVKIDPPIFVRLTPIKDIVQTERTPTTATSSRPTLHREFVAPTKVPPTIANIHDADFGAVVPDNMAMVGVGNYAGPGGDILSTLNVAKLPDAPQPKPRPAPEPAAPSGPVAVSAGVQAANLIYGPKPPYPPLARAAHIQGTVRIQAVIGADGSINSLKVMSGPPLLINAARDAVSQWRYQATLLSGRAVDVITEIDVIFTLSN